MEARNHLHNVDYEKIRFKCKVCHDYVCFAKFSQKEHNKQQRIVARNSHLLLTRVVSLGLNGSDIEQMSDNKDGRLPIEIVDIWNESFGYSMV